MDERKIRGSSMIEQKKRYILCIDFDGTCVTHDFPRIGKDIGAVKVIKQIYDTGNKIILWTMRSGEQLEEAAVWFYDNGIKLYGINYNPEQKSWTNSPKAYAQFYIDDAAIGCPLKFDTEISDRPFVDWEEIEKILKNKNII